MANVKAVAQQVLDALPPDADFSDLDEFLFERAQVEDGRDEFYAGSTRSLQEILPGAEIPPTTSTTPWSDLAASELLEARRNSHSTSMEETAAFEKTVLAAVESIVAAPERGLSLPEMGDRSIREVRIKTPSRITYRIVYDVLDNGVRILWFTSNITCYRNIAAAVESQSGS